jgi:hypothetical protein
MSKKSKSQQTNKRPGEPGRIAQKDRIDESPAHKDRKRPVFSPRALYIFVTAVEGGLFRPSLARANSLSTTNIRPEGNCQALAELAARGWLLVGEAGRGPT